VLGEEAEVAIERLVVDEDGEEGEDVEEVDLIAISFMVTSRCQALEFGVRT
jgi:hypothetical protein